MSAFVFVNVWKIRIHLNVFLDAQIKVSQLRLENRLGYTLSVQSEGREKEVYVHRNCVDVLCVYMRGLSAFSCVI